MNVKKILDRFGAYTIKKLIRFFSLLEFKTISKLHFLGLLFYYIFPLRKKLLVENLIKTGFCRNEEECVPLLKGIYTCQILNFFEFFWMSNMTRTSVITENFRIHGLSNFRKAISGEEGGVIVSSHLGNWELLAVAVGKIGVKMSALIVDRDIEIHKVVSAARVVTGNGVMDRNHSALKCMRLIKRKQFPGIVSDQHTDNAGVRTEFMGLECMSTSLPAALSLKTGCPIYGIFMIRSADYKSHDIYIEPALYAKDFVSAEKNDEDAITSCTQAVNDMIEKYIRMAPEQWFWFHKRWRANTSQTIEKKEE